MKYVCIPGVVYSGETDEQAQARENEMLAHNARDDERLAAEDKARRAPMLSQREWAQARGIWTP